MEGFYGKTPLYVDIHCWKRCIKSCSLVIIQIMQRIPRHGGGGGHGSPRIQARRRRKEDVGRWAPSPSSASIRSSSRRTLRYTRSLGGGKRPSSQEGSTTRWLGKRRMGSDHGGPACDLVTYLAYPCRGNLLSRLAFYLSTRMKITAWTPLWAFIFYEKWSYTVGTGVQMDRDVKFLKKNFAKCFFYLPWSTDNLSWPGLKFQMGFI